MRIENVSDRPSGGYYATIDGVEYSLADCEDKDRECDYCREKELWRGDDCVRCVYASFRRDKYGAERDGEIHICNCCLNPA